MLQGQPKEQDKEDSTQQEPQRANAFPSLTIMDHKRPTAKISLKVRPICQELERWRNLIIATILE